MSWHNFILGQHVPRDEVIRVCDAYIRSGKVKNVHNKRLYLEEFEKSPHDILVYAPQGSGWGKSPLNPNNWRAIDGSLIWEKKVIPKRTQTDVEPTTNFPWVDFSDHEMVSPTQIESPPGSESMKPKAPLIQTTESQAVNHEDKSWEDQRTGAGFGSPEMNKEVEARAVQHVIQLYESSGWTVISVENERCGFDLVCKKGPREEHVEVKGARGTEKTFIITAGELRKAKEDPFFVLCLVNGVLSDRPEVSMYPRRELARQFRFEPLAYKAVLK